MYQSVDNYLQNKQETASQAFEDMLAIKSGQYTSGYAAKRLNALINLETKLAILENNTLTKKLDISGFLDGRINNTDGDSGFYYDAEGNKRAFRFANMNHTDSVDLQQAVNKSPYKVRNQYAYVAKLTGKDVWNLTEEDFRNVHDYHTIETQKAFSDNNYQITPYDKSVTYTADTTTTLPFKYRIIGQDEYGRDLLEAVNASTGRQVSFDLSNNPFLNASHDLFKSLDNEKNKQRLEDYEKATSYVNMSEFMDTDNVFQEDLDIVQASAYQSWARVLNNLAPESWIDKEHWARVANPETGQAIANAWAGVSLSTQRKMASEMLKIDKAFENGDYVEGIKGFVRNLDIMLAQSAVQSAASLTGVVATGAAALSGVGLPAVAAALIGAATAAGDQTLSTMEEYKANNAGKQMSGTDIATNFAANLALSGVDTILLGMNIARFIPKKLLTAMTSTRKSGVIASGAKTITTSTVGEGLQEGAQGIVERYYSQNEDNKKSILDVANSHETLMDIAGGAVMGGALSATGVGVKAPFTYVADQKAKAKAEIDKQYNDTHTISGSTDVDVEKSNIALNTINQLTTQKFNSIEEVVAASVSLDKLTTQTNISNTTVKQANKAKANILRQFLEQTEESKRTDMAIEFAKLTNQSVQDIFSTIVHYSDYNAANVLNETGEQVTDEYKALEKSNLKALGKSMGLSDAEVKKTLDEVVQEVRYGDTGYFTYANTAKNIIEELKNPNLSEEDKNTLTKNLFIQLDLIRNLADNVDDKIAKFQEGFEHLASGAGEHTVQYKSGKGVYTLYAKEVADLDGSHRRNKSGMYALLDALETEYTQLTDILNQIPSDIKQQYLDEKSKSHDDVTFSPVDKTATRIADMKAALNRAVYAKRKLRIDADRQARLSNKAKGELKKAQPMNIALAKANALDAAKGNKEERNRESLQQLSVRQLEVAKASVLKEQKEGYEKAAEILQEAIDDRKFLDEQAVKEQVREKELAKEKTKLEKPVVKQPVSEVKVQNKEQESVKEDTKENIKENTKENVITEEIEEDTKEQPVKEVEKQPKKSSIPTNTGSTELDIEYDEAIKDFKYKAVSAIKEGKFNELFEELTTLYRNVKNDVILTVQNKFNLFSRITNLANALVARQTQETARLKNELHKSELQQVELLEEQIMLTSMLDTTDSLTDIFNAIQTIQNQIEELFSYSTIKISKDLISRALSSLDNAIVARFELYATEINSIGTHKHADAAYGILLQDFLRDLKAIDLDLMSNNAAGILFKPIFKLNRTLPLDSKHRQVLNEILQIHAQRFDKTNKKPLGINKYADRITEHNNNVEKLDINPVFNILANSCINVNSANVVSDGYIKQNLANENSETKNTIEEYTKPLTSELRVTGNPKCTLVTDADALNDSAWYKEAKKVIDKIVFKLPKVDMLDIKKSPIDFFFTYIANKAPHFRLLYQITEIKEQKANGTLGKTLDFKPNELMFKIIALSAEEYLSKADISQTLYPNTTRQLCAAFGVNDELVTREQLQILMEINKNQGVPYSGIIEALGNLVMENAGLKDNKATSTYGFYAQMKTELGSVALQYLIAKGVLEEGQYWYDVENDTAYLQNPKDVTTVVPVTTIKKGKNFKAIGSIVDNMLGKKDESGTRTGGILETVKQDSDVVFVAKPRTSTRKHLKTTKVRNTGDLIEIAEDKQELMKTLQNLEWKIDLDILDNLSELVANTGKDLATVLKERLGYIDVNSQQFKELTYDDQISQEGKNRAIEDQVDSLLDYAEKQRLSDTPIYFDWFESRNGRLFIDSQGLNPQTGKQLQRFLCTPTTFTVEYKYTEQYEEDEAFAIAQAFDSLGTDEAIAKLGKVVNEKIKTNPEWLTEVQQDLLFLSEQAFKLKYKVIADGVGFGGIENFGQCLNVLQHLKKKQEANGKPFLTNLAIENDSTTSGFAIRDLQFPVPAIIDEQALKVGIVTEDNKNLATEMHNLKKTKGFNDTYKSTAIGAAEELKSATPENVLTKAELEQDTFKIAAAQFYKVLYNALPKINADGSVSSALRNLMKPPTMTFGYTAGKKSICDTVATKIMYDQFTQYREIQAVGGLDNYIKLLQQEAKQYGSTVSENTITDLQNLVASVEYFNNRTKIKKIYSYTNNKYVNYSSIDEALKSVPAHEIRVTVIVGTELKNVKLESVYKEAIGSTYGEAIWNSLSNTFAEHSDINVFMSTAVNHMVELFKAVYNDRIKKLTEEYNGKIPTKVYEELLVELQPLYPTMPLLYEKRPNSGTALFRMQNDYNENFKVVNPEIVYNNDKKKYEIKQSGHFPRLKTPSRAGTGKAGAVTPIHGQDGAIMFYSLTSNAGTIPVHDAKGMSAFDNKIETYNYNRDSVQISQAFNLLEEMGNRLASIVDVYDKYAKENGLTLYEDMEFKSVISLNNSTMGSVVADYLTELISSDENAYTDIEELNTIEARTAKYNKDIFELANKTESKTAEEMQKVLTSWKNEMYESSTGQAFLMQFAAVIAKNNEWRDQFYNKLFYVSNMDGKKGSGYYHNGKTIADTQLEPVLKELGSDPDTYVSEGQLHKVLSDANDSVEGRIAVIDHLQNLAKDSNGIVESDEYLEHVKNVISHINPENIKETVVEVTENTTRNAGSYNEESNKVKISVNTSSLDNKTRLSPLYGKSAVEVYVHELKHAAISYALKMANQFGASKTIQELLNLQMAAMEHLDWTIFMPDNVPTDLQQEYEEQAKKLWNYIFNNPQKEQLGGLHEFITYGLTNKAFMTALKDKLVPTKYNKEGKTFLLDRIVSTTLALLDLVFGKNKVEAVATLKKVFTGEQSLRKQQSFYDELVKLDAKLTGVNNSAVNKLFYHPARAIEFVFKMLHNIVVYGNKIVRPLLEKAFNLADILHLDAPMPEFFESKWHRRRYIASATLLCLLSKSRRDGLRRFLRDWNNANQNINFALLVKDLETPDQASAQLDQLTALTRNVEQGSKAIQALTSEEMIEAFGKELNDEEATALTTSLLKTDLRCLGEDIEEIKKLLTDKDYRQAKIKELEIAIQTNLKETKNNISYNWIRNQALNLANYMVTGIGNEALCVNTASILSRGNFSLTYEALSNEQLYESIDKLVTLLAVDMTNETSNKTLATLSNKGLSYTMRMHSEWINSSINGVELQLVDAKTKHKPKTVNPWFLEKGYTKTLLNTSYDMQIDTVANEETKKAEGYVKVAELTDMGKATAEHRMAIYRRNFANPERREGATFAIRGVETFRNSLMDAAVTMSNSVEQKYTATTLHDVMFKHANNTSVNLQKTMETKLLTIDELQKHSNGLIPVRDKDGNITDFKITIPNEVKAKHFGLDTNGIHILSRMYAQQNTNANGKARNELLVQFLRSNMKHMDPITYRDIETKQFKYIKLHPDSNKFLKDTWHLVPQEVLREIKLSGKALYVREDWLPYLLGVATPSVTESSFVKNNFKRHTKFAIAISEFIVKCLAELAKKNIVMRIPAVLIGNVFSNFNYSVLQGHSPIVVAKKQLENAAAIRTYINDKRILNKLEFRKRLGVATEQELAKISYYTTKLNKNIVHPLMIKGMYQAIVEDINPDELEVMGRINTLIQKNKYLKKTPKAVKWMLKQLFMTEGTPVYDFMFQATQYSDFVARATEYQLRMDKVRKEIDARKEPNKYMAAEQQVSAEIWQDFVNYDKPQAPILKWASDMGLFMFTKFATRIQPVILKNLMRNPIGSLIFLANQSLIVDTEDIFESNLVQNSWSAKMHTPLENLMNAITPMPLQFALGQRSPF